VNNPAFGYQCAYKSDSYKTETARPRHGTYRDSARRVSERPDAAVITNRQVRHALQLRGPLRATGDSMNDLLRASRVGAGPALSITTLLLGVAVGSPALAAKPTPPDGCVGVMETTFPAFVFTKTIEVSQNVFATGTFLADRTGKCTRLIGTWPGSVDFRYNGDANLSLVLDTSGNDIVVGLSSVSFGASGPVATQLSLPTSILDTTQIPLPPDVDSTGWKFGGPEFNRVSPDGSQLLMKVGLGTGTGQETGFGSSIVTCSLSYDADSTIKPINPATCREVHRYAPLGDKWHEIVAWGALPGTIYSTHPSSANPMRNSLYRVTVQPPPAPSVVEELFHTGGILMGARANVAPLGTTVNGEMVGVFEHVPNGSTRCSQVIVIDAYNCDASLNCAKVNQKGMRSITWLPDGRLAGRGQTPPKKGNGTCLEDESFVAYPAIDSSNTPPTVLETTPDLPYNLCRTCIEGSAGGW
jgi:hypothetical protein